MVRNFRISIRVDEFEYDELKERADKEHLKLASYCRWQLFSPSILSQVPIERTSRGVPRRIVSQQVTDILKSSPTRTEVIKEMKVLFNEGNWKNQLAPVTEEMKLEVYENRLKDEFQPLLKLNPPK